MKGNRIHIPEELDTEWKKCSQKISKTELKKLEREFNKISNRDGYIQCGHFSALLLQTPIPQEAALILYRVHRTGVIEP